MKISLNVRKSFQNFLLSADVTLDGERVGIFGASGSGKSTLVSMLAGFLTPDSGEMTIDGETLFSSGRGINLPPEKRRISMVFQRHSLFPHMNVRKNLLYGYSRCSPEHRSIHLDDIVPVLQLGDLLDRGIERLSGGEQQRVALGRSILANPRLLLMDEPLSALDDSLRFQIIPYLRTVSERFRIPYLFISHSLLEMRLMTDVVIHLEKGAVTGQTSCEELARRRMGGSPVGYINIIRGYAPRKVEGLYSYRWGEGELLISAGSDRTDALFELSSKDIILFRKHPEAISARNLLRCTVRKTFEAGERIGVELSCGGETLIAEVVRQAGKELGIVEGGEIFAAIKASAFRRLE